MQTICMILLMFFAVWESSRFEFGRQFDLIDQSSTNKYLVIISLKMEQNRKKKLASVWRQRRQQSDTRYVMPNEQNRLVSIDSFNCDRQFAYST